ncbi:MAG: hypothetical protein AAFV95_24670 [Bacteroidota bacterium]
MKVELNIMFLVLLISVLLFQTCSKDEYTAMGQNNIYQPPSLLSTQQLSPTHNSSAHSSNRHYLDSLWQRPSQEQMAALWQDMMDKANVNQIGNFLYQSGLFQWSESLLLRDFRDDNYLLSIPTLQNDSISSLLFATVNEGMHQYFHITIDDLKRPVSELVKTYGKENTLLAITAMIKHQQYHGNYTHIFLYQHLASDLLADRIVAIQARGLCLIEVLIYTPPVYEEEDLHYSQTTGWTYWYDGNQYVPVWEGRPNLHGQEIGDGYTLYRFWAWCPDEHDQDRWLHGWTTNTDEVNPRGSSKPNLPVWDYNQPRWDEENKECLFAFDDPKATEKFNQLEAQLLAQSCGDAAEYVIRNTIDDMINRLCEEYYDGQTNTSTDPRVPQGEEIETSSAISDITNRVENHIVFEMGQKICNWCNGYGACLSRFNTSCTTVALDYEACVWNTYLGDNFTTQEDVLNWLIAHNEDLAALSEEMATAPAWMWPIVRELGVEIVVELLKRQFNLKLSDEIMDAIRSIQQGDLVSFMIAALEIVADKHPVTRGLKAIWDTTVLGKKAYDTWRKINALADRVGENVMNKIWAALEKTPFSTNFSAFEYLSNVVDRATLGRATTTDYLRTWRNKFPHLQGGNFTVHHSIERRTLSLWPGLFDELELNSIQNLRGISGEINPSIHLSAIRKEWDKFYLRFSNETPTRQQVLDFATHVDNMFGSSFSPPIR